MDGFEKAFMDVLIIDRMVFPCRALSLTEILPCSEHTSGIGARAGEGAPSSARLPDSDGAVPGPRRPGRTSFAGGVIARGGKCSSIFRASTYPGACY